VKYRKTRVITFKSEKDVKITIGTKTFATKNKPAFFKYVY